VVLKKRVLADLSSKSQGRRAVTKLAQTVSIFALFSLFDIMRLGDLFAKGKKQSTSVTSSSRAEPNMEYTVLPSLQD
jgi:hypothetical protein